MVAIVGDGGEQGMSEVAQRGQRRRITFGQIRIFTRSESVRSYNAIVRTPTPVPMRLQPRLPLFLSALTFLTIVVAAADDGSQNTERACTAHDGDTFYDLSPLQSRYTPIQPYPYPHLAYG